MNPVGSSEYATNASAFGASVRMSLRGSSVNVMPCLDEEILVRLGTAATRFVVISKNKVN